MNILQPQPLCKPLNTSILRPKYPRGGGGTASQERERMLIPSIDLMAGSIVQLLQGEKLKLAFDDFEYWIDRFSKYPVVQLIDLDAAMRQGENRSLIEMICKRLPCQVGGGLKTAEDGRILLEAGAQRVIYGSSLFGAAEPGEPRR